MCSPVQRMDSSLTLHTVNIFWLPFKRKALPSSQRQGIHPAFPSGEGEMGPSFPERTMHTGMCSALQEFPVLRQNIIPHPKHLEVSRAHPKPAPELSCCTSSNTSGNWDYSQWDLSFRNNPECSKCPEHWGCCCPNHHVDPGLSFISSGFFISFPRYCRGFKLSARITT